MDNDEIHLNVTKFLADLTDEAYARSHPERTTWVRRAIYGEVGKHRAPEAGDNRWYVVVSREAGQTRFFRLCFAKDRVFDEYMPEEYAVGLLDYLCQCR